MTPFNDRIYWLGFQLAISQALGLKNGGGSLLANMARVAPPRCQRPLSSAFAANR